MKIIIIVGKAWWNLGWSTCILSSRAAKPSVGTFQWWRLRGKRQPSLQLLHRHRHLSITTHIKRTTTNNYWQLWFHLEWKVLPCTYVKQRLGWPISVDLQQTTELVLWEDEHGATMQETTTKLSQNCTKITVYWWHNFESGLEEGGRYSNHVLTH